MHCRPATLPAKTQAADEEKAALLGELKAIKEQNATLAGLLAHRPDDPGADVPSKGKKSN
jgi:hypothetical protein